MANSIEMTRRRAVATAAGMFLAVGRKDGRTAAECYRLAARSIRRHGGEITWIQVRSMWVNRKRYTDDEITFIDHALRSISGADLPFDPRDIADRFSREAAGLLKSKASIF